MTPDEIATALTKERSRRNWTQTRVARLVGTTQSAISGWENCNNYPNIDSLTRWAAALGQEVTLAWIPCACPHAPMPARGDQ